MEHIREEHYRICGHRRVYAPKSSVERVVERVLCVRISRRTLAEVYVRQPVARR
jgi:hypothetical protein